MYMPSIHVLARAATRVAQEEVRDSKVTPVALPSSGCPAHLVPLASLSHLGDCRKKAKINGTSFAVQ